MFKNVHRNTSVDPMECRKVVVYSCDGSKVIEYDFV